MRSEAVSTRCCVVGGGPAGMMLGLLLARAGVDVLVLEKHADFLRDFRGDTLHPSTLDVIEDLGLMEELTARPHQKVRQLAFEFGEATMPVADFGSLHVRHPYLVLIPQWDFLDLLARDGARRPAFSLRIKAEAVELIEAEGRITGVRARTEEGELTVSADLVVAADGRRSLMREEAGLPVQDLGAPMDVFWFSIPHEAADGDQMGARLDRGLFFVRIFRGNYWQCGYVIPKGAAEAIRQEGLPAFRDRTAAIGRFPRKRVEAALRSWDDVKLLTVAVDRLTRWHRPGLLCIGDAAHAMSPVGGVGINLAIQDAVAAANILAEPLKAGALTEAHLAQVQRRREFPTRVTQRLQIAAQNRILAPVLTGAGPIEPPFVLRLLTRWPALRRLPAWLVGVGVRPERVRVPAPPA